MGFGLGLGLGLGLRLGLGLGLGAGLGLGLGLGYGTARPHSWTPVGRPSTLRPVGTLSRGMCRSLHAELCG